MNLLELLDLEARFNATPTPELLEELEAAYIECGFCACGCRQGLTSTARGRRTVNERHRQRAYRRRVETAAKAAGVEARLSLRAVRAANSPGKRNDDASARPRARQRRRRKGVSVYLPRPSVLELVLQALDELASVADNLDRDDLDAAVAAARKARARLEARR